MISMVIISISETKLINLKNFVDKFSINQI